MTLHKKDSPFKGLYSPLPDIHAYLKRIGFDQNLEINLDCLEKLIQCHLLTIPFENLDIFYKRQEPSLEIESMFRKIVADCRGGYCFELNGLFLKLLDAVGFSCFSSLARIVLGRDYQTPYVHRINFVKLGTKIYFCDVGYGGPGPNQALEIVYDTILTTKFNKKFRFIKKQDNTILETEIDGDFVPLMEFLIKEYDEVEFLPVNTFCSNSEYEPFKHHQMVHKLTPNGKCSINGNLLRIKENDTVTEIQLNGKDEFSDALKQYFGISYSVPE